MFADIKSTPQELCMKRVLYFAILMTFTSTLGAQSFLAEPLYRHQLTLTVGAHHGYVKDQNFSPLNYRAGGLRLGLGYGKTTESGHLLSAELGLGLTQLKSRASDYHTTDRYLIDLSFGYLRAVGPTGTDRRVRFGGKYRSYVDISIFEGAEAVTFFALHAFELAGDAAWRTGERHRLRVAGSLPVFGLLVRPPYTGWDKFITDNDTALLRSNLRSTSHCGSYMRCSFTVTFIFTDRYTQRESE